MIANGEGFIIRHSAAPKPHPRAWSAEEIDRLRHIYPAGGATAALKALPGRSAQAIYQRANALGLRCGKDVRSRNIAANVRPYHKLASTKERQREQGKQLFDRRLSADARRRSRMPAARAKAVAAYRATVMKWCPEAYWPLYRRLIDSQRFHAADARRIVEEQAAKDEARRFAALSPFEKMLERAARGVRLVRKPNLKPAGPAITLGGVSPEL